MAELNASSGKSTGKTPRKRLNARVDLTAMVDLAFLLITFFIMTTTMFKPKMFGVTMSDKEDPRKGFELSEKRTMTLVLGKNNQIVSYLGLTDKPLTEPKVSGFGKEGIRKAIIDMNKRVTESTGKFMFVIIKPSNHSVYNNLVSALDEVHITGMESYAITDITDKEVALLKQKGAY